MTDDIVRINCCKDGCGTFPMDRALYRRYKRTGEWWSCPAGHEQHFTESTEGKLRKRVEALEDELSKLKARHRKTEDAAHNWWRKHGNEKRRRRRVERLLFEHVVGVVKLDEGAYKWVCECGGHGQKYFETAEQAREAFRAHRDREGCGNSVPEQVVEA